VDFFGVIAFSVNETLARNKVKRKRRRKKYFKKNSWEGEGDLY
jgi:hypothetical protein